MTEEGVKDVMNNAVTKTNKYTFAYKSGHKNKLDFNYPKFEADDNNPKTTTAKSLL